jgi:hypothetical protein
MEVLVEKLTDESLLQWACSMTIDSDSNAKLPDMYRCERSPIRTQIFKVTMLGIPTFVSTHFVRHNVGCTHFVKTQRDDRGGSKDSNRWTPTNHGMVVNAQALISMARKRLCFKSHRKTMEVMKLIQKELSKVDKNLSYNLVPDCIYRGGCFELKSCGYYNRVRGVSFECF